MGDISPLLLFFIIYNSIYMCRESCCNESECNPCVCKRDLVGFTTESGSNVNVDNDLENPWAVLIHGGYMWTTANKKNKLIRYDTDGTNPHDIDFVDSDGSSISYDDGDNADRFVRPTGIVVNTTDDYKIRDPQAICPKTKPSTLLICSASGGIFGYNPEVNPDKAYRLYQRPNIASDNFNPFYTGLAVTSKYLFVANYEDERIDVFTSDCNDDPNSIKLNSTIERYSESSRVPYPNNNCEHVPYNIVYLNEKLYVIYIEGPDSECEAGGFIDIHNKYGLYESTFIPIDNTYLKNPWGLVEAPRSFGCGSGAMLISNHGDGKINVVSKNGTHLGEVQLKSQYCNTCTPLAISDVGGLRGLAVDCDKVYFASSLNALDDPNPTITSDNPNKVQGLIGVLKKESCNISCHSCHSCHSYNSCNSCDPCRSSRSSRYRHGNRCSSCGGRH
jgi:uncharacterized protein (TIGR03118 family)